MLISKPFAVCAVPADGKPVDTSSKPPGLIGSVATAPITGIQKLLLGVDNLVKKVLESLDELVSKLFEGLEKLLENTGGTFDGQLDNLKCVVKQPLKLLECF